MTTSRGIEAGAPTDVRLTQHQRGQGCLSHAVSVPCTRPRAQCTVMQLSPLRQSWLVWHATHVQAHAGANLTAQIALYAHPETHRLNRTLMGFNFLGPPKLWYKPFSLTQTSLTEYTTLRTIHTRKENKCGYFKQLVCLHAPQFHRNKSSVRRWQCPNAKPLKWRTLETCIFK